MKSLFNKVTASVMSVVPASLNPENQYAKSTAALLALLVSADKSFDEAEFAQVSHLIEQDASLRTHDLTTRAITYFNSYCTSARNMMLEPNPIEFPAWQTELIDEVRKVPVEFQFQLKNHISVLSSVSGPTELAVLQRINL